MPQASASLRELPIPPILVKLSYFSMSWLLYSSFLCSVLFVFFFPFFFFKNNRVGIVPCQLQYMVSVPPSFPCTRSVGEGRFLQYYSAHYDPL